MIGYYRRYQSSGLGGIDPHLRLLDIDIEPHIYPDKHATSGGAYFLKTIDGLDVARPWNGIFLKHYYV